LIDDKALSYNSVFSQSWTRQAYEAGLVTADFLNGAPFDAGYTQGDNYPDLNLYAPDMDLWQQIQANASTYQRLEVMDCIKAYNKHAVTDRKTVLVVTSDPPPTTNDSFISVPLYVGDKTNSIYAVDDFVGNEVTEKTWEWMCAEANDYPYPDCDLSSVLDGSQPWTPFLPGTNVDYCLSEHLGEQCTLDFCK
jgi:hypothetical protein